MPQFDRQAFGQRLRLLRDYREMTQQQVADFLNVNRSTYSYYENGKTEPSITTLMRMAELFNVTLDSLLNMEKDRDISLDQKCSCWNRKMESENCEIAKKRKSLHIFRTCGHSYKYKKRD
jgi:transcriptional regulator with XRE-family HTH domain